MNELEKLELIDKLIKQIDKEFGKKLCKEFNPECAVCKAHTMKGYLNWWSELINWDLNPN